MTPPAPGPEADFEAALWEAMRAHRVSAPDALPFIDAVKAAARLYAAGDSEGLTRLRREVLRRDNPITADRRAVLAAAATRKARP